MKAIKQNQKAKLPNAFLSYRRADSLAAARGIYRFLHHQFGRFSVFMDMTEIRKSDNWREELNNALVSSTVLIALIGAGWLQCRDKFGRRRIDCKNDWVREEILFALESGTKVIPVLIGDVARLRDEALDPEMSPLADIEPLRIRDENWENGLNELATIMVRQGFVATRTTNSYPRPTVNIHPYPAAELPKLL